MPKKRSNDCTETLLQKTAKFQKHQTIRLKEWLIPTYCLLCKSDINPGFTLSICNQCQQSFLKESNGCQKCGINIANPIDTICGKCLSYPPLWHSFNANYIYTNSIKKIIYQAKFKNSHKYCKLIALLMTQEIPEQFKHADFLIPTPLHSSRLKERGYNQALFISKELSSITKIPTLDCLEKIKATPPQSSLKKYDRLKSSTIFTLNKKITKQSIKKTSYKKHAIIIDDVLTTGSTAEQMSKALNKLGFSKIDVWVFARTC